MYVWCVNVYCLIDWGGLSSVCVVCHCLLSYRLGRSLQCVHVCVACHCLLSYRLGRSLQCVRVWRVNVCCLIDWGGLSSVCMCGMSLSIVL